MKKVDLSIFSLMARIKKNAAYKINISRQNPVYKNDYYFPVKRYLAIKNTTIF